MSTKIPILKLDAFLIASVQVALDDRSVVEFQINTELGEGTVIKTTKWFTA